MQLCCIKCCWTVKTVSVLNRHLACSDRSLCKHAASCRGPEGYPQMVTPTSPRESKHWRNRRPQGTVRNIYVQELKWKKSLCPTLPSYLLFHFPSDLTSHSIHCTLEAWLFHHYQCLQCICTGLCFSRCSHWQIRAHLSRAGGGGRCVCTSRGSSVWGDWVGCQEVWLWLPPKFQWSCSIQIPT